MPSHTARHLRFASLTLAAALAAGGYAPAPAQQPVPASTADTAQATTYEANVRVPMRDGVTLPTDVYRPAAPGRYPVLLIRTCYNKSSDVYVEKGRYWAAHGYVLLVQDVRGRGDADGEFYPLVHEAEDGYDAQSWAAAQQWSNGKVGTLGSSYLGWTQVYAAGLRNPALAAMVPTVTPPDPNRNFPTAFGIAMPSGAAWLAGLDGHTNQNLGAVDMAAAYAGTPTIDFDRRVGRSLKAWRDWVSHPTNDSYWQKQSYQSKLAASDAPMLHISGWYDDVQVGTTENFALMTKGEPAGAKQHLMIGPWGHSPLGVRKIGDMDFGAEAQVDMDGVQRRWFDHWLKGLDNGVDREPAVRVFVMGRNKWLASDRWPLANVTYTRAFLRSGGKANSRFGDGRLSFDAPGKEPADRFRYDPANPVPFLASLDWRQVGGPDDFAKVEERKDVLVYTMAPVERPTLICGPLKARIFAASSARDTDWTAKLLDVHPDGRAIRLNDGAIRARYRNGNSREELLIPSKVEAYDIDLWSTCVELAKGHSLRLEIASSAFGKTEVNRNTGGAPGQETETVVADQTVYHDRARASYILLPIVRDDR